MQERITLIEDLTKKRQPITNMEAIYFITPSEDSIARVLSDFADPARPQYKGIEIYVHKIMISSNFEPLA